MINPQVAVYLSDEEASLFRKFMERRDLIERLSHAGFFTLSDGKVEILIDQEGHVGDIYIHRRIKA